MVSPDLRSRFPNFAPRAGEQPAHKEPYPEGPEYLILKETKQVLIDRNPANIKQLRKGAAWPILLHFVEYPKGVTSSDIERVLQRANIESSLGGAMHVANLRNLFEPHAHPTVFVNTAPPRYPAMYDMKARARFVTREEWEQIASGTAKGQRDRDPFERSGNRLAKSGEIFEEPVENGHSALLETKQKVEVLEPTIESEEKRLLRLNPAQRLFMAYILQTDAAAKVYQMRTGLLISSEEKEVFADVTATIEAEEKGMIVLPKETQEIAALTVDIGEMIETIQLERSMAWRSIGNDEPLMDLMRPFFDAQQDAPVKVASLSGLWEEMIEEAIGIKVREESAFPVLRQPDAPVIAPARVELSHEDVFDEQRVWALGVSLRNLQATNELREIGIDFSDLTFEGIQKIISPLIIVLRERNAIPDIEKMLGPTAEAVRSFARAQDRAGFIKSQKLKNARELLQRFTGIDEPVLEQLADKIETIKF